MKRELRQTADGSSTLFVPELQEHYHSTHGALQESNHIFITYGLEAVNQQRVNILEVGFGTGLNAWLTAIAAASGNRLIWYTGIEKYPLNDQEVASLNYPKLAYIAKAAPLFYAIHAAPWETENQLSPHFSLQKLQVDVQSFTPAQNFDLIYFDAFAPAVQPELWSEIVFAKMFSALQPGGVLVTYCAQGQVKRNMKAAGFTLESLPGPPGKREITRARKGS